MPLGRKKETKSDLKTPAPITKTVYTNPLGDVFTTSRSNSGVQTFTSDLSSGTQNIVGQSISGMQSLAKELNAPDAQRVQMINDRSNDYYSLQSQGINSDVNDSLSRTKADLSKRFGGSYNATFGTDLLANIENNRVQQLSDARKQANMYGEELYQQDENSRIQRFNLFQNYLNDLNNQARGLQTSNSTLLLNESQLASSNAIAAENLANVRAQMAASSSQEQARQNKEAAARIALQVAGMMI